MVGNGFVVNRSLSVDNSDPNTGRISTLLKRNDANSESYNHADEPRIKKPENLHITGRTPSFNRNQATLLESATHDNSKSRYYGAKVKNYHATGESKDESPSSQHYRSNNNAVTSIVPIRFASQSSANVTHREATPVLQHSRPSSRTDTAALGTSRKPFDQQNALTKMAPINFPPLRAPQSIVDVRHPFVTEARTKHSETGVSSVKIKTDVSSLQSGVKELAYTGHAFHGYGTSTIAGIPSIQSLGNVRTNMSPYVRSDSYGQPTVANVVYSDSSQFPQSAPFSGPQVGQYQTYDHSSYAPTTVNVNPVMTQYSNENSIQYPRYDNSPQFVQTNHYAANDLASGQYQYQAAGVGQIQESPLFLQSLQSPIAVTDQYTASNYARAVRTELIPRLHQPPRFNKQ